MAIVRVRSWHARLAKITGAVSLQMELRHLSKRDLSEWSSELLSISEEMKTILNAPPKTGRASLKERD